MSLCWSLVGHFYLYDFYGNLSIQGNLFTNPHFAEGSAVEFVDYSQAWGGDISLAHLDRGFENRFLCPPIPTALQ